MKRSLGIIFSLMMIMTAFMGCDFFVDDEWETITLPYEPGSTTPAGTVTIRPTYPHDTVGAKGRYYWGRRIEKNDFYITVYKENGITSTTNVPEGVLVELSTDNDAKWERINFGTTTYPQKSEIKIRAYLNGKESLGGTTTIRLYEKNELISTE